MSANINNRVEIVETGCYLDNHRGHYIVRDMIELACGYGFIIGPCERFVIDSYDKSSADENYPYEALYEMSDKALEWLNIGENTGLERPMKGQNSPPVVPAYFYWGWNEGDFGLYAEEEN